MSLKSVLVMLARARRPDPDAEFRVLDALSILARASGIGSAVWVVWALFFAPDPLYVYM